jgi:hypothetical protein
MSIETWQPTRRGEQELTSKAEKNKRSQSTKSPKPRPLKSPGDVKPTPSVDKTPATNEAKHLTKRNYTQGSINKEEGRNNYE